MTLARLKLARLLTVVGVLGLAASGAPQSALGQGLTADPYNPYNASYEQYVYPTYPNGLGLTPNQNVLMGRSAFTKANRFDDFMEAGTDRFDVSGSSGGRRGGVGTPYYSTYREYDRDYNRVYQPNQDADAIYLKEQRTRHEKYLSWLRERDPKKRAALYRDYMQESRRASRDLDDPRAVFGRSRAAVTPEPVAPGARRSTPSPSGGGLLEPATPKPRAGGPLTSPSGASANPTDILRRSREMDRSNSGLRRPTVPSTTPR